MPAAPRFDNFNLAVATPICLSATWHACTGSICIVWFAKLCARYDWRLHVPMSVNACAKFLWNHMLVASCW
jgi:hypothetical protein